MSVYTQQKAAVKAALQAELDTLETNLDLLLIEDPSLDDPDELKKRATNNTVEIKAIIDFLIEKKIFTDIDLLRLKIKKMKAEVLLVQGDLPPEITDITPASGPEGGGTACTITGQYFDSPTVDIDGSPATVTAWDPTSITLTTPSGAAGFVDVLVTNLDTKIDTLVGGFEYQMASPPSITSISPTNGPEAGGTSCTIVGTDFDNPTVDIDGMPATVDSWTATSIDITTPAGTAGAVDVVVTNADTQFDTLVGGFTYDSPPAPSITSISPTSGPEAGGTNVIITGTDFNDPTTVDFDGMPATINSWSATSIDVDTPMGTAGFVDVYVENTDTQNDTLAGGYEYT